MKLLVVEAERRLSNRFCGKGLDFVTDKYLPESLREMGVV
jgi:hypothetical protein